MVMEPILVKEDVMFLLFVLCKPLFTSQQEKEKISKHTSNSSWSSSVAFFAASLVCSPAAVHSPMFRGSICTRYAAVVILAVRGN